MGCNAFRRAMIAVTAVKVKALVRGLLVGAADDLSPLERDELIVRLRRAGHTFRAIANYVGISEKGVRYALERIAQGRVGEGRDRRT